MVKGTKNAVGRPSVMTDDILQKILEARADGATPEQACLLAEVSVRAYYYYVEKNPEFLQMMERAKDILSVLANRRLRKALDELPKEEAVKLAWDILKNKEYREDKAKQLPQSQLPGGPRLTINMGPSMTVNAKDFRDDELEAIASGQKTTAEVLEDRDNPPDKK